jgi:hypothetical protein
MLMPHSVFSIIMFTTTLHHSWNPLKCRSRCRRYIERILEIPIRIATINITMKFLLSRLSIRNFFLGTIEMIQTFKAVL